MYIADGSNNRIRKVTLSTGIITTLAGTGATTYNGDNVEATSATLNYPSRVMVDSSGGVYICETFNYRIRKVTNVIYPRYFVTIQNLFGRIISYYYYYYVISVSPTAVPTSFVLTQDIITTIAGTGDSSFSGDGGTATSASLSHPYGIALDSSSNVYIADQWNHRIRKMTVSTGIITTIAGSGTGSYGGDNGAATSAMLNYPTGVAVDTSGRVTIVLYAILLWINTFCI